MIIIYLISIEIIQRFGIFAHLEFSHRLSESNKANIKGEHFYKSIQFIMGSGFRGIVFTILHFLFCCVRKVHLV